MRVLKASFAAIAIAAVAVDASTRRQIVPSSSPTTKMDFNTIVARAEITHPAIYDPAILPSVTSNTVITHSIAHQGGPKLSPPYKPHKVPELHVECGLSVFEPNEEGSEGGELVGLDPYTARTGIDEFMAGEYDLELSDPGDDSIPNGLYRAVVYSDNKPGVYVVSRVMVYDRSKLVDPNGVMKLTNDDPLNVIVDNCVGTTEGIAGVYYSPEGLRWDLFGAKFTEGF